MKRRHLLKAIGAGCIGFGIAPELMAKTIKSSSVSGETLSQDEELKDYLYKIRHFDDPHDDDILIAPDVYPAFESTLNRLLRLQKLVGYGNFNILNFPDAISLASSYSSVGEFSKDELNFMETIFYEDGQRYGFMGQKPLKEITDQVNKKEVIKIPHTGNFLYKERSIKVYEEIKKELGDKVILTSGVRSVMKQFILFLNKVHDNKGNLSLASRSLAPPGYSFHGNGDFDVGQKGYGKLNFTEHFTETEVFKRLSEMGYLKLRYPQDNNLGVRYEPWHIKINA